MNETKFLVACNWDYKLLDNLKEYSPKIKYIYGKINTDIFSGGRAASEVKTGNLERQKAAEYIAYAKKNGIQFNYLLNGTTLPNQFSKATIKKIYSDLEWISSLGINYVTVTIAQIAKIIKRDFSHLNLSVSVFAHVRTLRQIEEWQSLGAKSINLDRNLSRDLKALRHLQKYNPGIDYILLVNDPCKLNCAIELEHDRMMSDASISNTDYYHYCSFSCLNDFIDKPEEILKTSFIRPEDLKIYEDIGIRLFKIVDRNRTTKFIVNAVKAYMKKHYDGNLMDLMSLFSAFDRKINHEIPEIITNYSKTIIDGFWGDLLARINFFVENNNNYFFNKRIKINCEENGCSTCDLCHKNKNLVKINKTQLENVKTNIKNILKFLETEGLENEQKE